MRGALRYFGKLLAADKKEWTYLPYLLRMKARGIDLSWVSVSDLGLDEARSNWYGDSGGPFLEMILRAQPIGKGDAILDIGCGKGGAMLTMLGYPFGKVDGVEISPVLVETARRNLSRAGAKHAQVFCSDATEFRDLDRYTWFYMYNPFPAVVMGDVINNIRASIVRTKRRARIIYNNPVHAQLVEQAGFRKIGEFRLDVNPCFIYAADGLVGA